MIIAGGNSSTPDSTPAIVFISVTGANFMRFALSDVMPGPSEPSWSSWVDYQDAYDEFDISSDGVGPIIVWAQLMDLAGNQSSINDGISFDDTSSSFDVQYYSDPDLTNSLGKNPYLAAGIYYIKITANKSLLTAPTISIDANADADLADANDVNGVATEKLDTGAVRTFRYKRLISPGSINKGMVKEDITLSGLYPPSNEATGAAYIDTVAPVISTPPSKITWTNTAANLAPTVTEDSGQQTYKWETVKGTGKVIFGDSEGASTTVEGGAGEQFTVTLRFTTSDAAGYADSNSFDFEWDKKNPTGYVTINGEDDYAASLSVNLSIDGFDAGGSGLDQMELSEDSGFATPTWEPFVYAKPWPFTTGEGERFIYLKLKDKAGNESQVFNDSITMDTVVPAAVTGLQAALTATPGEIKLTWTNPPPAEFAGVMIVGSASSSWTPVPGEDYTEGFVLAQNLEILYKGTAETYTHTGLAADGSTHYYRAFTYDAALNYSTVATANAALADEIPPSEVKYFSAAFLTPTEVRLSWSNPTADSDWVGVEIRRDTSGYPADENAGTHVYKGASQPFTDTSLITDGSKTYYYAAFSYDAAATPNYSSGVRTIITPGSGDNVAPGPITNFTATPGDGHIALSWTNPTDTDFEGVVIRRDFGTYPINQWAGELVYNGAGTSVDDTGLINDTDYYYAAFTYDGVPNYSTSSVKLIATPQDTDPPTVVSVYPADGATAVAFDTDVRVKFSEPMNGTTINATNFTMSDDTGSAVTGTVTYNALNLTAIFTPASDLDYNIEYTATVSAQVKDLVGNALGTDKVWSFTTRSKGYWDTMIWDADEWN